MKLKGKAKAVGAAAPPGFRNLCSKSPNHVVYSPTIDPLPRKAGAPPETDALGSP